MFVKTKSKNNEQNKKSPKVKKVSNKSEENEGSSIELDDPCAPKVPVEREQRTFRTPGLDPRFQQQNQTLRCYVMYADFFQCEHLLGEGHDACKWFKDVYMSICPNAWVEQWDEYRSEGRMPWFKKAEFPKAPYGK